MLHDFYVALHLKSKLKSYGDRNGRLSREIGVLVKKGIWKIENLNLLSLLFAVSRRSDFVSQSESVISLQDWNGANAAVGGTRISCISLSRFQGFVWNKYFAQHALRMFDKVMPSIDDYALWVFTRFMQLWDSCIFDINCRKHRFNSKTTVSIQLQVVCFLFLFLQSTLICFEAYWTFIKWRIQRHA